MRLALAPKVAVVEGVTAVAEEDKVVAEEDEVVGINDVNDKPEVMKRAEEAGEKLGEFLSKG
jgi:hypothetical protein